MKDKVAAPAEKKLLSGSLIDSLDSFRERVELPCGTNEVLARYLAASEKVRQGHHRLELRAHAALTEQLLCASQRSWLQLLLLLTQQGASVGRWMLAKREAYSGEEVKPAWDIQVPSRVKVTPGRYDLDAEELAESCEENLLEVIPLVTGGEKEIGHIVWPKNKEIVVSLLGEVLLKSLPGDFSSGKSAAVADEVRRRVSFDAKEKGKKK